MDQITIQNLEIFANHGVFPEENTLGQKFVLSAVLYTSTRKAGISDTLEKSIHYGEVSHFIKNFVEKHTYKLLESVVEHLAEELLLAFPLLEQVELEIEKPWAPIGLPLETVSVKIKRGWHIAYLALGSNMGDKKAYLDQAVRALSENPFCQVKEVADYIETEPYGGVEQDCFLNSVLCLRTLLLPDELLELAHEIEQAAGRERLIHWGPRTLDVDILFYDDRIVDDPVLHIPHIDLHRREFVLKPLNQIAPYLRHPVLQKTVGELYQELVTETPRRGSRAFDLKEEEESGGK